ncbi:hypothetical protein [Endozoicomonas sp. GU-1]|uniref:hypothetical protein n=1 Tax=Endozoicomonas sp. GU-1 TaxID=3009078 RepID=UPI0022B5702C|nr:hypothetical protein [Endozoicomonas sp. GU-1]WBA83936.1 hypothetical protein O2T12_12835 [Endozoicomonas sp. GU-1]WBA86917.1 hypothetical protein O3276_02425 [Endozoicomonas sp. GU-1]
MNVNGTTGNTDTIYKFPLCSFDNTPGQAFGMKVEEHDGAEDKLASVLFEGCAETGKSNEGFVVVIGRKKLKRLQDTDPDVFAGLYNASPVSEPSESVFSRVCTLVTDIISAYLNTGQS